MWSLLRETLFRVHPREDALADAVRDLCGRMQAVDSRFAEETDQDLVDACIYERLSLQAHYRYLTRELKQREQRCQMRTHRCSGEVEGA